GGALYGLFRSRLDAARRTVAGLLDSRNIGGVGAYAMRDESPAPFHHHAARLERNSSKVMAAARPWLRDGSCLPDGMVSARGKIAGAGSYRWRAGVWTGIRPVRRILHLRAFVFDCEFL